jgi:hypothetical protein
MIKDILNDIFSPYSSFGDKCLAALIALLMLVGVGLLGLLAFILVDSVGITPTKTTVTVVEEKQVVPPTTYILMAGKIFIPQHHPKSYRLHFKIDGEEVSLTVEKKFFDDIKVGDKIEVDYGFGRLSNSRQPTKIRLVTR